MDDEVEGTKSEQLTFRVSEDEVKFFDLVIRHSGVPSFTRLCDYAIRKMVDRIELGAEPLASEFKAQLMLWKPPLPANKQKNIRLTVHTAERLRAMANALFFGTRVPTMLRFILLFEGRVMLQAPSFTESREQLRQLRQAQLLEQQQQTAKARAALVTIAPSHFGSAEQEES